MRARGAAAEVQGGMCSLTDACALLERSAEACGVRSALPQ